MDQGAADRVKGQVALLLDNIGSVIYAKRETLEHLIAAKIAGGHVMLADSHGVGKTSLARALAGSFLWSEGGVGTNGTQFSRIQCTVDLLPQDILGFSRFDGSSSTLSFYRGPIFAHFVLCDEINLLTPKTQGSFFQAMEEQTVTVEGKTHELPDPFFIIATMNLKGVHLFPLPAPQLDRFMIQLSMGFPDASTEARIITQHGREDGWKSFKAVIRHEDLLGWQALVDEVYIHPDVVEYIVACVRRTRETPDVQIGATPRSGVKISRLARALSLIRGQTFVTVDLVKEIFVPAVAHRIVMQDPTDSAADLLRKILDSVPVEKR
jgi:MoxR-like ATPase